MSFHLKDFDKFDINECTNDINNIKENIMNVYQMKNTGYTISLFVL